MFVVKSGVATSRHRRGHHASTPHHQRRTRRCGGGRPRGGRSWTPYCADYGVGYGIVSEDDNYPNHAEGKVYKVPVIVTLWGSRAIKNHPGDDTYTRMTLILRGKRPAVY